MRKKAILLGNGKRQGVLQGVETLRSEIESEIDVVAADFEDKLDLSDVEADLAIVFGGDGSILRAVRQMKDRQLPVLAVNLGTLGFLSSLNPDEVGAFMRSDAFKNFEVRERRLLVCSVWRRVSDANAGETVKAEDCERTPGSDRDGEERDELLVPPASASTLKNWAAPSNWNPGSTDRLCLASHLVVNEAALLAGPPFTTATIDLAVDGARVTTFRGDGLIIATPVGSTGHSLSAGGPILRNDLDAVLITPLSPQTLNFRPVVDSASRIYETRALVGEVFLVIDGESRQKLTADDLVVVRKAPFPFKTINVPSNMYYRNLQRKLGWATDALACRREFFDAK